MPFYPRDHDVNLAELNLHSHAYNASALDHCDAGDAWRYLNASSSVQCLDTTVHRYLHCYDMYGLVAQLLSPSPVVCIASHAEHTHAILNVLPPERALFLVRLLPVVFLLMTGSHVSIVFGSHALMR